MLERYVKLGGVVCKWHDIQSITHNLTGTHIEVLSWIDGNQTDSIPDAVTTLHKDLDYDATLAGIADWCWEQPEFEEWVSPPQQAIDTLMPILNDEQAEAVIDIWPIWKSGVNYLVGNRVSEQGILYRCIQAHTAQIGWEPSKAVSLWVRTTPEGTIPEWVQPTGAHDAYNRGDKVRYNEQIWISTVDSNVWAPGVYGWSTLNA